LIKELLTQAYELQNSLTLELTLLLIFRIANAYFTPVSETSNEILIHAELMSVASMEVLQAREPKNMIE
jgi:hypothetical protein